MAECTPGRAAPAEARPSQSSQKHDDCAHLISLLDCLLLAKVRSLMRASAHVVATVCTQNPKWLEDMDKAMGQACISLSPMIYARGRRSPDVRLYDQLQQVLELIGERPGARATRASWAKEEFLLALATDKDFPTLGVQCENVRRLYQQLATAVEACTLPTTTTTTTCSPGTPSTRQMQAHVHHASHDADALDWAVALEPLPPLPQREAVQVRVPAHVGGDAASGSGRRCPRTALQQSSAPQHGACGPHTKAPSHVSAQPQTIPRKETQPRPTPPLAAAPTAPTSPAAATATGGSPGVSHPQPAGERPQGRAEELGAVVCDSVGGPEGIRQSSQGSEAGDSGERRRAQDACTSQQRPHTQTPHVQPQAHKQADSPSLPVTPLQPGVPVSVRQPCPSPEQGATQLQSHSQRAREQSQPQSQPHPHPQAEPEPCRGPGGSDAAGEDMPPQPHEQPTSSGLSQQCEPATGPCGISGGEQPPVLTTRTSQQGQQSDGACAWFLDEQFCAWDSAIKLAASRLSSLASQPLPQPAGQCENEAGCAWGEVSAESRDARLSGVGGEVADSGAGCAAQGQPPAQPAQSPRAQCRPNRTQVQGAASSGQLSDHHTPHAQPQPPSQPEPRGDMPGGSDTAGVPQPPPSHSQFPSRGLSQQCDAATEPPELPGGKRSGAGGASCGQEGAQAPPQPQLPSKNPTQPESPPPPPPPSPRPPGGQAATEVCSDRSGAGGGGDIGGVANGAGGASGGEECAQAPPPPQLPGQLRDQVQSQPQSQILPQAAGECEDRVCALGGVSDGCRDACSEQTRDHSRERSAAGGGGAGCTTKAQAPSPHTQSHVTVQAAASTGQRQTSQLQTPHAQPQPQLQAEPPSLPAATREHDIDRGVPLSMRQPSFSRHAAVQLQPQSGPEAGPRSGPGGSGTASMPQPLQSHARPPSSSPSQQCDAATQPRGVSRSERLPALQQPSPPPAPLANEWVEYCREDPWPSMGVEEHGHACPVRPAGCSGGTACDTVATCATAPAHAACYAPTSQLQQQETPHSPVTQTPTQAQAGAHRKPSEHYIGTRYLPSSLRQPYKPRPTPSSETDSQQHSHAHGSDGWGSGAVSDTATLNRAGQPGKAEQVCVGWAMPDAGVGTCQRRARENDQQALSQHGHAPNGPENQSHCGRGSGAVQDVGMPNTVVHRGGAVLGDEGTVSEHGNSSRGEHQASRGWVSHGNRDASDRQGDEQAQPQPPCASPAQPASQSRAQSQSQLRPQSELGPRCACGRSDTAGMLPPPQSHAHPPSRGLSQQCDAATEPSGPGGGMRPVECGASGSVMQFDACGDSDSEGGAHATAQPQLPPLRLGEPLPQPQAQSQAQSHSSGEAGTSEGPVGSPCQSTLEGLVWLYRAGGICRLIALRDVELAPPQLQQQFAAAVAATAADAATARSAQPGSVSEGDDRGPSSSDCTSGSDAEAAPARETHTGLLMPDSVRGKSNTWAKPPPAPRKGSTGKRQAPMPGSGSDSQQHSHARGSEGWASRAVQDKGMRPGAEADNEAVGGADGERDDSEGGVSGLRGWPVPDAALHGRRRAPDRQVDQGGRQPPHTRQPQQPGGGSDGLPPPPQGTQSRGSGGILGLKDDSGDSDGVPTPPTAQATDVPPQPALRRKRGVAQGATMGAVQEPQADPQHGVAAAATSGRAQGGSRGPRSGTRSQPLPTATVSDDSPAQPPPQKRARSMADGPRRSALPHRVAAPMPGHGDALVSTDATPQHGPEQSREGGNVQLLKTATDDSSDDIPPRKRRAPGSGKPRRLVQWEHSSDNSGASPPHVSPPRRDPSLPEPPLQPRERFDAPGGTDDAPLHGPEHGSEQSHEGTHGAGSLPAGGTRAGNAGTQQVGVSDIRWDTCSEGRALGDLSPDRAGEHAGNLSAGRQGHHSPGTGHPRRAEPADGSRDGEAHMGQGLLSSFRQPMARPTDNNDDLQVAGDAGPDTNRAAGRADSVTAQDSLGMPAPGTADVHGGARDREVPMPSTRPAKRRRDEQAGRIGEPAGGSHLACDGDGGVCEAGVSEGVTEAGADEWVRGVCEGQGRMDGARAVSQGASGGGGVGRESMGTQGEHGPQPPPQPQQPQPLQPGTQPPPHPDGETDSRDSSGSPCSSDSPQRAQPSGAGAGWHGAFHAYVAGGWYDAAVGGDDGAATWAREAGDESEGHESDGGASVGSDKCVPDEAMHGHRQAPGKAGGQGSARQPQAPPNPPLQTHTADTQPQAPCGGDYEVSDGVPGHRPVVDRQGGRLRARQPQPQQPQSRPPPQLGGEVDSGVSDSEDPPRKRTHRPGGTPGMQLRAQAGTSPAPLPQQGTGRSALPKRPLPAAQDGLPVKRHRGEQSGVSMPRAPGSEAQHVHARQGGVGLVTPNKQQTRPQASDSGMDMFGMDMPAAHIMGRELSGHGPVTAAGAASVEAHAVVARGAGAITGRRGVHPGTEREVDDANAQAMSEDSAATVGQANGSEHGTVELAKRTYHRWTPEEKQRLYELYYKIKQRPRRRGQGRQRRHVLIYLEDQEHLDGPLLFPHLTPDDILRKIQNDRRRKKTPPPPGHSDQAEGEFSGSTGGRADGSDDSTQQRQDLQDRSAEPANRHAEAGQVSQRAHKSAGMDKKQQQQQQKAATSGPRHWSKEEDARLNELRRRYKTEGKRPRYKWIYHADKKHDDGPLISIDRTSIAIRDRIRRLKKEAKLRAQA